DRRIDRTGGQAEEEARTMTAFVDRIVVPWLWFLGDWSWRWGVVLAALAAWLVLRTPRRAATRHLLFGAAPVAGGLPPVSPRRGAGLVPGTRRAASPAASTAPRPSRSPRAGTGTPPARPAPILAARPPGPIVGAEPPGPIVGAGPPSRPSVPDAGTTVAA